MPTVSGPTALCPDCGGDERQFHYTSPNPRTDSGYWVDCETCGGEGYIVTEDDEDQSEEAA